MQCVKKLNKIQCCVTFLIVLDSSVPLFFLWLGVSSTMDTFTSSLMKLIQTTEKEKETFLRAV